MKRLRGAPPSQNINRVRSSPRALSGLNNSVAMYPNFMRSSSLGNDVVRIHGRETLNSLETTSVFTLSNFRLMPTDSGLFPRLNGVARLYQRYRFNWLRARYIPSCPATTPGALGLAFQTDAVATAATTLPVSLAGFGDMASGVTGSVCYPLVSEIKFDREFPWYDLQSSNTEELAVWASLLLGRSGGATTPVSAGLLYLEYEVEFKYPNLSAPLSIVNNTPNGASGNFFAVASGLTGAGALTLYALHPGLGSTRQEGIVSSNSSQGLIGTAPPYAASFVTTLSDSYNLNLASNRVYYFYVDTTMTYSQSMSSPGALPLDFVNRRNPATGAWEIDPNAIYGPCGIAGSNYPSTAIRDYFWGSFSTTSVGPFRIVFSRSMTAAAAYTITSYGPFVWHIVATVPPGQSPGWLDRCDRVRAPIEPRVMTQYPRGEESSWEDVETKSQSGDTLTSRNLSGFSDSGKFRRI